MSGYYYTDMSNVFVGALCVIGVFLISYKGENRKEAWAGDIAGFAAVGVGLFPTYEPNGPMTGIGDFHIAFAAILYLTLAYFSLLLFPRGEDALGHRRIVRNRVYRICGSDENSVSAAGQYNRRCDLRRGIPSETLTIEGP